MPGSVGGLSSALSELVSEKRSQSETAPLFFSISSALSRPGQLRRDPLHHHGEGTVRARAGALLMYLFAYAR